MSSLYSGYYPPGVQNALMQQQQSMPMSYGYPGSFPVQAYSNGTVEVINPHETTSIVRPPPVVVSHREVLPVVVEHPTSPITYSYPRPARVTESNFRPGDHHPVHGKTAPISELHLLMEELNDLHRFVAEYQEEARVSGATFLTQNIRTEINNKISKLRRI